jgi:hypothetical protein
VLDIIIPAHKPNYVRLAYRGLNPNGALTTSTILGSLPSAVGRVPVAGKVILSLEGGKHQDFEAAEAYLSTQNLAWQVVHSSEVTGYYQALMRGLERATSPLVAVVPPWVEITDDLWVQRMTWPMTKDTTALLCGTWGEPGPARDLAPHIVKRRVWPGGDAFIARREALTDILRMSTADNFRESLAGANGWQLWAHPGIRFKVLEHEQHEAKQTTR